MSSNENDLRKISIQFEGVVGDYLDNLFKFQYEKAKTSIEKHKESAKVWSVFQAALLQLINAEKSYNNLIFLNQRLLSKHGDKYYEPTHSLLDQIIKEYYPIGNASSLRASGSANIAQLALSDDSVSGPATSHDFQKFHDLNSQLYQFIEFRFQMMSLYYNLKESDKDREFLEATLRHLNELDAKYASAFDHDLLESLRENYTLEMALIRNLIDCHLAIDHRLDAIGSIVCLKEINDILCRRLPSLNVKQSKESLFKSKGFLIFSRSSNQQRTIPSLYQWFKLYYDALLTKFSIVMHDSFNAINDVEHIEKVDLYSKLTSFVKKATPYVTGILMDLNNVQPVNFRGAGYEIIPNFPQSGPPGIEGYTLVFSYPKQIDGLYSHLEVLTSLNFNEGDCRVKCYYEQNLKSTYYYCKVSSSYIFFMIFEMNKQENKNKTTSFVQEIRDELNIRTVYDFFNANLK